MKRVFLLLALAGIFAGSASARARAYGYCMNGGTTFNVAGLAVTPAGQASYPGCQVDVYFTGTTTHAPIYADNSGTSKGNPFNADTTTGLWFWYADNNRYDVKLSGGTPSPGLGAGFTLGDIVLVDTATLAFSTYFSAPFSATPTFNLVNGTIQAMVLTGNVTSSATSNQITGSRLTLVLCQDATGGRTFVWPASFIDTFTIASGANQCSEAEWYFNGVSWKLFGNPMVGSPLTTLSANTWTALQTFSAGIVTTTLTDSALSNGNCVQAGLGGLLTTVVGACSVAGASVTSVGLSLPFHFIVTNSPVTSSGTLTGAWAPAPPSTVFAGPLANSVGGILDGSVANNGTSTSSSATINPGTAHDWAFFTVQTAGAIGATPSGWSLLQANGAVGVVYDQVLNSSATLNVAQAISPSSSWTNHLFTLALQGGAPTIVQTAAVNGGFSTSFATGNFGGSTTTGNSILAILYGVPPSGVQLPGTFSDVTGDTFTTIAYSQNGSNQYTMAALATNITGGAGNHVTFTPDTNIGAFSSNELVAIEVSGLVVSNNTPIFRRLIAPEIPSINLGASGRGGVFSVGTTAGHLATWASNNGPLTDGGVVQTNTVQVFSATTLGGDVAVSATTQTDVMTRTITMPSTGCPCRVLMSYSLYITTASSGIGYSAWVNDGSANMAGTNMGQTNGSSGALAGLTYSGYTTVTYSNNTAVTFTLRTEGDHTYTVKAGTQVAGSAPNSSFQVAAVTSN
jgi:hypothetical protein